MQVSGRPRDQFRTCATSCAPFTEPDNFAALCKGYRYPICSLYLDSPDLALYRQTVAGEKDRFKLRVSVPTPTILPSRPTSRSNARSTTSCTSDGPG